MKKIHPFYFGPMPRTAGATLHFTRRDAMVNAYRIFFRFYPRRRGDGRNEGKEGIMRTRFGYALRRLGRTILLPALLGPLTGFAAVRNAAIIADHTSTDLGKIPPAAIEKAKKTLRIAYGHTSHGSQIVAGMDALRRSDPARFGFGRDGDGLSLWDATPKGDLGNPDRSTWAARTRELLTGPGKDRNVIVWSWCGQAGSASEKDIQTYLELMSKLEQEFPGVTFVYMTGHLDGTGKTGNLHRRNEQIRAFCRANRKVLFDFADIESYDPDGKVNYLELNAKDSCDYRQNNVTKNWADEWLKRNPGHGIALPGSAAHSRPLNAALKGRAFWHLLARLAGWDGAAAAPKTMRAAPPSEAVATAQPDGDTSVNRLIPFARR
jgi:hypothetical protein